MGYLSNFMEVRPILCPPARERRRGSRKVGNGHVELVALGPIFWPPKFTTYSTPPQSLLSRRTCRTKAVRESNICPNFGENAAIKHRHKTPPTRFFAAIDIRTSQMRYHCKARRVRPTRHDRLQPSPESSSSSPPCGRAQKWIKAAEAAQMNDRKRNSQRIQRQWSFSGNAFATCGCQWPRTGESAVFILWRRSRRSWDICWIPRQLWFGTFVLKAAIELRCC